jgi:hypothetical protein
MIWKSSSHLDSTNANQVANSWKRHQREILHAGAAEGNVKKAVNGGIQVMLKKSGEKIW